MARKRRKTKRKQKKQAHRIAPMPSWFEETPWGTCRWCNCPILKEDGTENKRRRWHPDCLHEYLIITDARYAKRQVKKRDKGVCRGCGKKCRLRSEWQLDHIVPLKDRLNNDLSWFSLSNMQTLCIQCHLNKTVRENLIRKKRKK